MLFLVFVDAIPGLHQASSSIDRRFSQFINSGNSRQTGHECREMSELKWHSVVDLMGTRATVKLSAFAQKVFHDNTFQAWLVACGDKIISGTSNVDHTATHSASRSSQHSTMSHVPGSHHGVDRTPGSHKTRPMSAPRTSLPSRGIYNSSAPHPSQPHVGSGAKASNDRNYSTTRSTTAAGYSSSTVQATQRRGSDTGGFASSSSGRPSSASRAGMRVNEDREIIHRVSAQSTGLSGWSTKRR